VWRIRVWLFRIFPLEHANNFKMHDSNRGYALVGCFRSFLSDIKNGFLWFGCYLFLVWSRKSEKKSGFFGIGRVLPSFFPVCQLFFLFCVCICCVCLHPLLFVYGKIVSTVCTYRRSIGGYRCSNTAPIKKMFLPLAGDRYPSYPADSFEL
jgi:hypothetical protein